jgi:microcystin-dependent protein
MLSLGSGNWRLIDSQPASGSSLPPGSMVDFGGTVAPGGWLLCNGQLVSRTGYALLFAAIGTAYGVGDGSTTFAVPDFRGRAAIGDDLMGTSAAGRITTATVNQTTRGGVGGAQTHALTVAELAAHAHTASSGNDSPDHTHTVAVSGNTGFQSTTHSHLLGGGHLYVGTGGTGGTFLGTTSAGGTSLYGWGTNTATASNDHTHTFADASSATGGASVRHTHTITVNSNGSGSAINMLQPSLIVMRIIKT